LATRACEREKAVFLVLTVVMVALAAEPEIENSKFPPVKAGAFEELLTIPVPMVKKKPERLNEYAGAPELNWRAPIAARLENVRFVVFDAPNVAVNVGTVAGVQLAAVFQTPDPGLRSQVELRVIASAATTLRHKAISSTNTTLRSVRDRKLARGEDAWAPMAHAEESLQSSWNPTELITDPYFRDCPWLSKISIFKDFFIDAIRTSIFINTRRGRNKSL
jgi:hypothetical protein